MAEGGDLPPFGRPCRFFYRLLTVDLAPIQRRSRWRRLYALGGRGQWPPSGGGGMPGSPGGDKRGRDTKVSLPLLTPQPFLWTRLPSVARLKARSPQGRLLLQGHILDRSGAFRSRTLPLCTVWPRTVMRGSLRKVNSGHNSIPKSARRPEPSPRTPVSPRNRRASRRKGGFGGVKRGKGNHLVPLPPLALRRGHGVPPPPGGGNAQPCHGEYPPAREGLSRLRRQAAGTAEPLTLC